MLRRKIAGTQYLIVIVMTVVWVSSACVSAGDTPRSEGVIAPAVAGSETYTLGQTVYTAQCAVCHGANGEGQFADAPLERDITGRYGAPPHDDTGHTWHHDDDLLIQVIGEGGMGDPINFYVMPAFETILSDREIEAVISYIKTMWTPDQQTRQHQSTLLVREQNAAS